MQWYCRHEMHCSDHCNINPKIGKVLVMYPNYQYLGCTQGIAETWRWLHCSDNALLIVPCCCMCLLSCSIHFRYIEGCIVLTPEASMVQIPLSTSIHHHSPRHIVFWELNGSKDLRIIFRILLLTVTKTT